MKIGVFCSANKDIDPDFFTLTEELGRWIGDNGHRLVFGGCDMGLMECVARAAHDHGALTIGVIPTRIEENGHVSRYVDVAFRCDNLSDRKEQLINQSDVLIALPGGVGTLDEIFTAVASATIGYHSKRVILYDMKGFWAPLTGLLDILDARHMIRGDRQRHILTARNLTEIAALVAGIHA